MVAYLFRYKEQDQFMQMRRQGVPLELYCALLCAPVDAPVGRVEARVRLGVEVVQVAVVGLRHVVPQDLQAVGPLVVIGPNAQQLEAPALQTLGRGRRHVPRVLAGAVSVLVSLCMQHSTPDDMNKTSDATPSFPGSLGTLPAGMTYLVPGRLWSA
jgi:hypothetical protein